MSRRGCLRRRCRRRCCLRRCCLRRGCLRRSDRWGGGWRGGDGRRSGRRRCRRGHRSLGRGRLGSYHGRRGRGGRRRLGLRHGRDGELDADAGAISLGTENKVEGSVDDALAHTRPVAECSVSAVGVFQHPAGRTGLDGEVKPGHAWTLDDDVAARVAPHCQSRPTHPFKTTSADQQCRQRLLLPSHAAMVAGPPAPCRPSATCRVQGTTLATRSGRNTSGAHVHGMIFEVPVGGCLRRHPVGSRPTDDDQTSLLPRNLG
jgi:hypothetical protein